ncbi:MAG: hypothetical protein QM811_05300 [Pirellulales bacterium]
MDLCQWANQADDTTPIEYLPGEDKITCVYANGVKLIFDFLKTPFGDRSPHYVTRLGTCPVRFVGSAGSVETGDSGEIVLTPETLADAKQEKSKRASGLDVGAHARNFFDCVKSRQAPICNSTVMRRSHIACHAAALAWVLQRPLEVRPDEGRVRKRRGSERAAIARGTELASVNDGNACRQANQLVPLNRNLALSCYNELRNLVSGRQMNDMWGDSPIHPILDRPHEYEILRFDYHNDPRDHCTSYLDLTLSRQSTIRRLRFLRPQRLVIEEGFPATTNGMIILDIRHRQWENLKVEVADFEASQGENDVLRSGCNRPRSRELRNVACHWLRKGRNLENGMPIGMA